MAVPSIARLLKCIVFAGSGWSAEATLRVVDPRTSKLHATQDWPGAHDTATDGLIGHLRDTIMHPQWRPPPIPLPPWLEISQQERDADLVKEWHRHTAAGIAVGRSAPRAPADRQLQEADADADADVDADAGLAQWVPKAPSRCEDLLAANTGQRATCKYSCDTLQAYYFPDEV